MSSNVFVRNKNGPSSPIVEKAKTPQPDPVYNVLLKAVGEYKVSLEDEKKETIRRFEDREQSLLQRIAQLREEKDQIQNSHEETLKQMEVLRAEKNQDSKKNEESIQNRKEELNQIQMMVETLNQENRTLRTKNFSLKEELEKTKIVNTQQSLELHKLQNEILIARGGSLPLPTTVVPTVSAPHKFFVPLNPPTPLTPTSPLPDRAATPSPKKPATPIFRTKSANEVKIEKVGKQKSAESVLHKKDKLLEEDSRKRSQSGSVSLLRKLFPSFNQ